MQGNENASPSVGELLAASEAVLLTSLQEGFGLPYLEAAAAGALWVARETRTSRRTSRSSGLLSRSPTAKSGVDPEAFDWRGERQRQARWFAEWKSLMPAAAARLADKPAVLAAGRKPRPVPFSRLTLTAQLEVLPGRLSGHGNAVFRLIHS